MKFQLEKTTKTDTQDIKKLNTQSDKRDVKMDNKARDEEEFKTNLLNNIQLTTQKRGDIFSHLLCFFYLLYLCLLSFC